MVNKHLNFCLMKWPVSVFLIYCITTISLAKVVCVSINKSHCVNMSCVPIMLQMN